MMVTLSLAQTAWPWLLMGMYSVDLLVSKLVPTPSTLLTQLPTIYNGSLIRSTAAVVLMILTMLVVGTFHQSDGLQENPLPNSRTALINFPKPSPTRLPFKIHSLLSKKTTTFLISIERGLLKKARSLLNIPKRASEGLSRRKGFETNVVRIVIT